MVDAGLVALAYYLAFWLRFDESLSRHGNYKLLFTRTLPWVMVGTVAILALSRVYQRRWRYVGQRDIELLIRSLVIATVLLVSIVSRAHPVLRYRHGVDIGAIPLPLTVIVVYFLLSLVFLSGARVLARAVNDRRLPGLRAGARGRRNVLIVGAGQGGRRVCQELARNADLGLHPVGYVDDDPLKQRLRFEGVRVRGTTRDLAQILDDAEPGLRVSLKF